MKCFVSSYDQYYNQKYKTGLRQWDRHRVKWEPEAVDRMSGTSLFFKIYYFNYIMTT